MLNHDQSAECDARRDVMVLRFSGELDSWRADAVRRTFARVPAGATVVVVLTDVPFVDSAGLGAVIGGIRRVREANGDAVVCGAGPGVTRVLTMSGVDRFVRVERDVAAAVLALSLTAGEPDRSRPVLQ